MIPRQRPPQEIPFMLVLALREAIAKRFREAGMSPEGITFILKDWS